MGLAGQYKTDPKLERKGIVLNYDDEVRIRIARAGGANKAYLKAQDKAMKPHRKAIATGDFSNDRLTPILISLFAAHVVLGWETKVKEDDNGNPVFESGIDAKDAGEKGDKLLVVNHDNIVKVFKNLPDLFQDVAAQAQSIAAFRADIEEATAGN